MSVEPQAGQGFGSATRKLIGPERPTVTMTATTPRPQLHGTSACSTTNPPDPIREFCLPRATEASAARAQCRTSLVHRTGCSRGAKAAALALAASDGLEILDGGQPPDVEVLRRAPL